MGSVCCKSRSRAEPLDPAAFGKGWFAEHWGCVGTLPVSFQPVFKCFLPGLVLSLRAPHLPFSTPKRAPSSVFSWFPAGDNSWAFALFPQPLWKPDQWRDKGQRKDEGWGELNLEHTLGNASEQR